MGKKIGRIRGSNHPVELAVMADTVVAGRGRPLGNEHVLLVDEERVGDEGAEVGLGLVEDGEVFAGTELNGTSVEGGRHRGHDGVGEDLNEE